MSAMLAAQVRCLRLRVDAPFPSQLKGRAQRWLRLVLVHSSYAESGFIAIKTSISAPSSRTL